MTPQTEALKLALEALVANEFALKQVGQQGNGLHIQTAQAITALKEALIQQEPNLGGHDVFFPVGITRPTAEEVSRKPEQEPVAIMPSNTRYTVEVEGRGQTYWDNIHDAITNAQRAVYSGPDNTTRALDDLKAGRIAEWSYGFSAVRIYPPQSATPPQRKHCTFCGSGDHKEICDSGGAIISRTTGCPVHDGTKE